MIFHVLWGLRVFACIKSVERNLLGTEKLPKPFHSNVSRIASAIKPRAADGTQQIVVYFGGIGALGTPQSRFEEAVTGNTMVYKIRYAYRVLMDNYTPGDKIFLFGYSRGAFTARAVVDFIRWVGILQKGSVDNFYSVWDEYRSVSKIFRDDLNSRPESQTLAALLGGGKGRVRDDIVCKDIKIRCVGVFDTVGSLKAPPLFVTFSDDLQIAEEARKRYDRFDIHLDPEVENVFQAQALDERRFDFYPAVLERPVIGIQHFNQTWFPGVHADMGGRTTTVLGLFPLAWMIGKLQAACLLDLDEDFVRHNIFDALVGADLRDKDDWRPSDLKITPSHWIDRHTFIRSLIPSWLLPWTRIAHRNPHMAANATTSPQQQVAAPPNQGPEQTFHWTVINRINKPTGYWERNTTTKHFALTCTALRRPDPMNPNAQITKQQIEQRMDAPTGIDGDLYRHFNFRERMGNRMDQDAFGDQWTTPSNATRTVRRRRRQ